MNQYKETQLADGITKYELRGNRQWLFYIALTSFIFYTGFVFGINFNEARQPQQIISPLPTTTPTPEITITPEPKPTVTPKTNSLRGTASYYSRAGCLGCSDTLTMANGETLDDTKHTIALTPETVSAHKLLNDEVRVINVNNGQEITAKVTDTGGFAKYNRVADLGVAVKEAINCTSLCEVVIEW